MFSRPPIPRNYEQGEKPFWISYADLMTAMMMLFLVVMAFSLIVITNPGPEIEHGRKIQELCSKIKQVAEGKMSGILVDCVANRIDFGSRAQFGNNDYHLTTEAKQALREFIPILLDIANQEPDPSKRLLKRVVIEGYASKSGTYLHNLQLSMRRAEAVLCSLFDMPSVDMQGLKPEQKAMVRDLFLVGGYSFNNGNGRTEEQMRRVEFKLEFLGIGESNSPPPNATQDVDFGICRMS